MQFPDGVGDACDVRPNRAGDDLWVFEPFAFAPTAVRTVAVTVAGDQATAEAGAVLASARNATGDGLYVRVHVAAGSSSGLAITLDPVPAGPGPSCALVDGGGGLRLVASEAGLGSVDTAVSLDPEQPSIVTAFRSTEVNRSVTLLCFVQQSAEVARVSLPGLDDLNFGNWRVEPALGMVITALEVYTTPRLADQEPR
jgi:hypothetical protein